MIESDSCRLVHVVQLVEAGRYLAEERFLRGVEIVVHTSDIERSAEQRATQHAARHPSIDVVKQLLD